jgi:hypothetical protein
VSGQQYAKVSIVWNHDGTAATGTLELTTSDDVGDLRCSSVYDIKLNPLQ